MADLGGGALRYLIGRDGVMVMTDLVSESSDFLKLKKLINKSYMIINC